jgi:predicted component of type VI protein secretion system
MVRDLANQVEATRKELVAQMSRGFNVETMRGPQFEQMLRLLTLNRYSVRLQFIAEMQAVTTAQAYLELRGLLAELAALQPGNDVYDVAGYDHDNPAISFMDLNQQIRPHLRSKVRGRYSKVDFTPADGGMFAQLSEEHLAQANEYFIAVRSKQDPRGVAALVQDEDRFKLMARSMIRQAVRGVKLQEERQPPLQLPTQTGVIYFRLLRTESARMWEMIQREKIIGARWVQMESSDFQLALYMTLPEDAPVAAAPRPRT